MNIYSPTISGSLTISGSIITTGGGLPLTGSLISSGSFTSIGTTVVSGSFTVVTGSAIEFQVLDAGVKIGNLVTDSHSITGSLIVSGSTNHIGATHLFTGSLLLSGSGVFSSSVADYGLSITNIQDASQGLLVRASDNDTGQYILNLQSSVGATSQTWVSRLAVEKGGNVGIGTASPSYVLDIAAGSNGNVFTPAARITTSTGGAGGGTILQINHTANSVSGLQILQAGASGGNYTSINNTENGYMSFSTSGSERMRITSAGNVGIGTTSPISTLSVGVTSDTSSLGSTGLTIGGASTLTSGNVMMLNFTPIGASSNRARAGIGCLVGSDWGTGNLTFYTRAAADASAMTTADEKMRISSTGIVTTPYQPSFYIVSNGGQTDYTTNEVIIFNTARHNIGSHYNTSTGRFTAPVAGRYLFTLNVYAYPNYTAAILLTINGAQYSGGGDVTPYIYTSSSADSKTISFTLVWELSASDYVEVRARSTTRIYRAHSHFSGCLLS